MDSSSNAGTVTTHCTTQHRIIHRPKVLVSVRLRLRIDRKFTTAAGAKRPFAWCFESRDCNVDFLITFLQCSPPRVGSLRLYGYGTRGSLPRISYEGVCRASNVRIAHFREVRPLPPSLTSMRVIIDKDADRGVRYAGYILYFTYTMFSFGTDGHGNEPKKKENTRLFLPVFARRIRFSLFFFLSSSKLGSIFAGALAVCARGQCFATIGILHFIIPSSSSERFRFLRMFIGAAFGSAAQNGTLGGRRCEPVFKWHCSLSLADRRGIASAPSFLLFFPPVYVAALRKMYFLMNDFTS